MEYTNKNIHKFSCSVRMLCILLFFAVVYSDFSAFADGQIVVKVGYIADYGVITDNEGLITSGYCYEYLNEIAKYTGWIYEFIPVEWNEGFEKLQSGELDLFGPMQKNESRETLFDFHEKEMGFEYGALYVSDNNTSVFYDDPSSFDGMKVATESNNFYNMRMEEYCKKNNINVEFVYVDNSLFESGLNSGEFDGFIGGSLMNVEHSSVVAKLSAEPYYYPTTKGNTFILDGMNAALNAVFIEDIYYSARLDQKYYGNKSINMPAFTKEELDFIVENPVLFVAYDPSWAPIEYYDKKSGTYKGINVDILNKISKICGITFQYLQAESYEESKKLMTDGIADLLMGYTRDDSNMLPVLYTNPFLEIPVILIGNSNSDFSNNSRVALRKFDSPLSIEIMDEYPHFIYVEYETSNQVVSALKKGKVDAAFVSTYVFDELARLDLPDGYITLTTKINFPQCIGIRTDSDPIIISILNKSINRLTAEETSSIIFANTINRVYSKPFLLIVKENSVFIIVLLSCFFIIIFLLSRKNRQELEKIAYVDTLTQIPTLNKFKINMLEALKSAFSGQYALISIDIDDFKYINDSFGYSSGNQILISLSKHFSEHIMSTELIARTSADNFIFLLEVRSPEVRNEFYHTMRDVNEHLRTILPEHYNIVMSIGVYIIKDPTEEVSIIIDKANFARKSIKNDTAVDYAEYTADMDMQAAWKKNITLSMEHSLVRKEFEVYLQPKYLLSDESLAGAEALVRWNHPQKGLLQPSGFIPIFEQNGFITKIDMYMFEQICILLNKWKQNTIGADQITVSVNLSRLHLYNTHLVTDLLRLTSVYGIEPKQLEVELTESTVFNNTALLVEMMNSLREKGFKISIDDFGSGYSSLNMLKDLPVDVLKIDKSFLSDSVDDSSGQVIIASVIKMAKNLHLTTVAEGVETKEQAEMLFDMGCDIAQGYYYAKPLAVPEFEKLL